jgi:hypothetical protein
VIAAQDDPKFLNPHRLLAASYAYLGRLEEAYDVIKRLKAITTAVIPLDWPYRRSQDRELLLSGLRLAMGERT